MSIITRKFCKNFRVAKLVFLLSCAIIWKEINVPSVPNEGRAGQVGHKTAILYRIGNPEFGRYQV